MIFLCQKCGAEHTKWAGKCDACGEWNSLVEFREPKAPKGKKGSGGRVGVPVAPTAFQDIETKHVPRIETGIAEFDRTLGGGIVPGSVILLGGDPGIGKSTLLLEIAEKIAAQKNGTQQPVLYISGEESAEQIKLRAGRLGVVSSHLLFLSETTTEVVTATIAKVKPRLVIVDSIQTIASDEVAGVAGSMVQVRCAAQSLIAVAKTHAIPIVLVGHITKEGTVAGPKTLEHLVDAVLYLEGDRISQFRILRSAKNRFGSVDEIGIFEMNEQGLAEVVNPSQVFLEERGDTPGSVIAASIEGSRAMLLEVQALTSRTNFGYPKRQTSGFDLGRLQLLAAVLTKRAGLSLFDQDVYLNLTGGIRVIDPALDLAVSVAVASAFYDTPVPPHVVAIGEVGLGGEVRRVRELPKRVREAEKLGFRTIIIPQHGEVKSKATLLRVSSVREAIQKAIVRKRS